MGVQSSVHLRDDRMTEEYASLYIFAQSLLGKTSGLCGPYLWIGYQGFLVGLGNTLRSQGVVTTSSASGNNINCFSCSQWIPHNAQQC